MPAERDVRKKCLLIMFDDEKPRDPRSTCTNAHFFWYGSKLRTQESCRGGRRISKKALPE